MNEELESSDSNIEVRITTIDNPFDPFDQFDDWYAYDIGKGYNTCERVARLCVSSDELSQDQQNKDFEQAIDDFINLDVLGIYKKVIRKY